MNRKISKLLKKVAKTNPYGVENIDNPRTLYQKSKSKDCIQLAPGLRLTYKYLKRFYEEGKFTAQDARDELADYNVKQSILEIREDDTPSVT
jgi:hypothetical protein